MPQINPHPNAPKHLVLDNLRLIWYVIKKHYYWHDDRNDLVYPGYCGLTKAAGNYLPSRGSFSTFAFFYIFVYIKRYLIGEQSLKCLPFDERFHGVSQEDTFVLKELLQKAPLTDREHKAIELYDLHGLLLKDLAAIFKVSVERASKIRKEALKKLSSAS